MFTSCRERGIKIIFLNFMRNGASDLPRSDALLLSNRDSLTCKAHYEVRI